MPKQPLELRVLFPEDLEITPLGLWSMRCFGILILAYGYWTVENIATSLPETVFLGGATLFFGSVSWWGVLFLFADPAGTNRREQIRSQPLRSIDCPECESTVAAKHLDCPECGSDLR